jgi:hypothetical protein
LFSIHEQYLLAESRFEEVTTSHTFSKCDYKTFLKILLDNKHRQPEPSLFKAASKWILTDNSRVELSEEIFRLLGISPSAVQHMVKQSTLQLLQNGAGPASTDGSSCAATGSLPLQPPNGVGVLSDGNRGLTLAGLHPLQLLQNGAGVPLSTSLSLQLQQQGAAGNAFSLASMVGQDQAPMLLTLMNGNQLHGSSGVGMDRGGLSDMFRSQMSSPGNGAGGAGQKLQRCQNNSTSEQDLGESSGKWPGSGDVGSAGRKDHKSAGGGSSKRGKKEEQQQQHSPSSDWVKGNEQRTLHDFGLGSDQIHEVTSQDHSCRSREMLCACMMICDLITLNL